MSDLSGLGPARMIPRKSLALASLFAAAACCPAWAQTPAAPAQPAPAQPAQTTLILERIVLVEQGPEGEQFEPGEGSDFVVASPGLSKLNVADLNTRLAAGKGQPVSEQLLAGITQVIEGAIRPDFPLAAAVVRPQRMEKGALRVTIALLKIRDVKFIGNRWFSNSLLQNRLQVSKGEIVQISDLEQSLRWTNNSPYRRVQLRIDQIPNTDEATLVFGVQDKIPLRFTATADNSGNDAIGRQRFTAGLSYGNVFGKEHEASYTYITTNLLDIYRAHVVSYRIPFGLKSLQFSGSYATANPTFVDGVFVQKAVNTTADIRYTVPLRTGDNPIEAFASTSFKRSNNDLEFFSTNVNKTSADIVQLTLGMSAIWRDKRGAWAGSVSATGSPGGVTSHNTDLYFGGGTDANGQPIDEARPDAKARYAYASLSLQRYQILPFSWELAFRSTFQIASGNLLPSEQISVGGANSVRGYQDSIVGGDRGFILNTELITPAWRHALPGKFSKLPPLEGRMAIFFDAGATAVYSSPTPQQKQPPIASAGLSIRAALPGRASITADYGFQLSHLRNHLANGTYTTYKDGGGRGHVKLVIAF